MITISMKTCGWMSFPSPRVLYVYIISLFQDPHTCCHYIMSQRIWNFWHGKTSNVKRGTRTHNYGYVAVAIVGVIQSVYIIGVLIKITDFI